MKKNLIQKTTKKSQGIATMEVVMIIGIAALMVTGIAYIMKNSNNTTTQNIENTGSINADDINPGSSEMFGSNNNNNGTNTP